MTSYSRSPLLKYLLPLFFPLLILLSGGCHRKSPTGATRVEALITSAGIEHSLNDVLDHNLTQARPGTPTGAHAANWLADTFSQYGLRPGGNRQTFFVEYPLPDDSKHQFARNIVGETPGMRIINGGILLTTVYNRVNTDETQSDSDAVRASAARVASLLEIANATAGRPGDTPIYFSARSEESMPEAKNISTVLNLRNGRFKDDTLRILADSIPGRWRPFLRDLSDSVIKVDFKYRGITSSISPNVKMNVCLPTKLWVRAMGKNQRQKGLDELAHSAQIIRSLLYKIAMLQPDVSTPEDSTRFAPRPAH